MTDCGQAPGFQYHVSGVFRARMEDGPERDIGPGEVSSPAAGHDAWVVGRQAVELVNFQGLSEYARALSKKQL